LIYYAIDVRETWREIWCSEAILENQQCQLFRTLREHPEYYSYIRILRFLVGARSSDERIPPKSFTDSPDWELDAEEDRRSESWIIPLHDNEHYV
jgi:hypothetical protein